MLLLVSLLLVRLPLVAAEEQPRYGGTMIEAIPGNPSTFNPATTSDLTSNQIGYVVYEPLLQFNSSGIPEPRLAQSWNISSDGLTYTFNLVRNATWHDGEPFTSADVKFTIENITRIYHSYGSICYKSLDKIETPDNYTVIFKLQYAFPPLLQYLQSLSVVLPKHLYEGTDVLNNTHNLNPVGTGPFKFVEFVRGSHVRLVKNENYWRSDLPYLDAVVIKIIPDATARVMALEKGEVHYIMPTVVPIYDIPRLATTSGVRVEIPPCVRGGLASVEINNRSPPLNDINVRKALAHALDREFIHSRAYFGLGHVGTGPIANDVTWAYTADVPKYEYNVTKANELLDAAGYTRGSDGIRFGLSVAFDVGRVEFRSAAEVMKEYLKEVGVDLTLKPVDSATLLTLVFVKWEFDLAILPRATGPDPSIATARTYRADNIKHTSWTNCMGYNNSNVDLMWDEAEREIDEAKRVQIFYDIQKAIMEDCPVIPLWNYVYPVAYNPEFHNIRKSYNTEDEVWRTVWWEKGTAASTEPTAPTGGIGVVEIIAIAATVVAIVAIGALIYVRRRK